VDINGIVYKSLQLPSSMEEAMQALVFFWCAGLLFLTGGLLAFFSKAPRQRKVGLAMACAGFFSLLATPWTASASPSSAFGHLLGSVLGPAVLLAVGFYQIAFSGNVPVGRLSATERRFGVVMVVAGVLWFEAMHWWRLTPTYPDQINRLWLIFWPTLLLSGFAFACGARAVVERIGDGRQREQALMVVVALFMLALVVLGVSMDGPSLTSERFAAEVLLAGADLFGVVVGAAMAVLLFAIVLFLYESTQVSVRLPAPTNDQLRQAGSIVAKHLSGGEEE
jgi:hypothetical protein